MFEKKLFERDEFIISKPIVLGDKNFHEPDITITDTGDLWCVWSERSHQGDLIKLQKIGQDRNYCFSEKQGVEFQPAILSIENGFLIVVWVVRRNNKWHLISRSIIQGKIQDEEILHINDEGIFRPRLLKDKNNNIWIIFEIIIQQKTYISYIKKSNANWSKPVQINNSRIESMYRPNISVGPKNGIWIAYDTYNGSNYDVYIQQIDIDSDPIKVNDNYFQNLHNSITSDKNGNLWITWSSNFNKAYRDKWWLTKWPCIRLYDGLNFYDPCSLSPDIDIYGSGPYQGWEFPEILIDNGNRVWVFGQSSHTQYAQYYSGNEWSELITISEKCWGSWKPRIRALSYKDYIYLASFGLNGGKIQKLTTKSWTSNPKLIKSRNREQSPKKTIINKPRKTLILKNGETLNYFFGDLHTHTAYGDGVGDIDEIYYRYRDAYGYDFAAITEHDYLDGIELSKSEFNLISNYANRFNKPGSFVTLIGYEWTPPAIAEHVQEDQQVGEGHKNIYFPGDTGALLSFGNEEYNSATKLFDQLKGEDVLIIPHHTGWSGICWNSHNDKLQRLIEICSIHGRFEYPGNEPIGYRRDHVHLGKFVIDGLNKGLRLGFVGGSDSHGMKWHHTELEGRKSNIPPGTRIGWKRDAYRGGMTVIISPTLDRESLFKALYNRNCYATSGEPIIIDFRINNEIMGSEIITKKQPCITALIEGTAPLKSVDIIRSGHILSGIQSHIGRGVASINYTFIDQMVTKGEIHYYYLRVVQEDENMAWSSPIWVDYR